MDDTDITAAALAAGRGDRAAATAFITATHAGLRRFLRHLAGTRDVDDLVQETYLRAWRSLPSFAARSSAQTWLFTIARRVAVDHVRSAVARPRSAHLEDWQGAAETATAGRGVRHEDSTVLLMLIDTLAPERREAFVATQVLGLSYAEAAEVCNCPIGTVRSRVARAREDLIEAMAADGRPVVRRAAGRG
ncbi:sigma-70 family RNA polymerase sigma factor [Jidongwangia harbinensis]|uniref:sigma-70 family RNA polymerase sigma factor n=1 Tax=Jidongwangia harbinensis TaxID=2878561 RepID=UPI001CD91C41|nr:sigma-70 family RNA polymerase sigma factor [Jidongwangia harbinensis]MCA2211356.1 sigma-70 family RNA polymerase sigma factor [Jidongwangia harbinensis]